jgi:hypothetical protein
VDGIWLDALLLLIGETDPQLADQVVLMYKILVFKISSAFIFKCRVSLDPRRLIEVHI